MSIQKVAWETAANLVVRWLALFAVQRRQHPCPRRLHRNLRRLQLVIAFSGCDRCEQLKVHAARLVRAHEASKGPLKDLSLFSATPEHA